MMHRLAVRIHDGFTYIKLHPQFLMTLLLVIVIPVSFIVSGQQFLDAAKDNQERLEKDRVGILHDAIMSLAVVSRFDIAVLQKEIDSLARQNADFIKITIIKEEGGVLRIVASNSGVDIGSTIDDQTKFRSTYASWNHFLVYPYAEYGVRYWHAYRLIDSEEYGIYYTFTESSLENTDNSLAQGIIHAYYWLCALLLVILFLLHRHMKLIDYAYLYRETKQANEMKDMFTNMIAHELRAPLTAMKGYASMVREDQSAPPQVQSYGRKIEDSADRLVVIINVLLDVARIHSGKLAMKAEKTDIQKVITSVLEIMQSTAKEKNISLTQDVHTMELYINIDPKRFHQALTNLVSNSIKYTNAGSITVSVEERDDRVEVRVKDTGTGISAENQGKLFTPFFRVGTKEVSSTVGTGLGMWITKQLIELMNGSIAVESIKGVGTHAVVTLPK
jgi:signal transduction histidine kinase